MVCVCTCARASTCHGGGSEDNLWKSVFPCGFWGSNSGPQGWWQVPLSFESSCWPQLLLSDIMGLLRSGMLVKANCYSFSAVQGWPPSLSELQKMETIRSKQLDQCS